MHPAAVTAMVEEVDMGQELLGKWLGWWQPLCAGLSRWGVANGLILTGGWFWARTQGGYLLYRSRQGREQIDWQQPVGAGGAKARRLGPFPWLDSGPAGPCWFVVRAVGPGGVLGKVSPVAVGCCVDEHGRLVGGLPGDIERLWTQPGADGRVLLCWSYDSRYEAAPPDEFTIYCNHGAGEIDYGQPVASVPCAYRRPMYSWLSEPYAPGSRARFGVRATNAAGQGVGGEVEVTIEGTGPVWQGHLSVEETADGH